LFEVLQRRLPKVIDITNNIYIFSENEMRLNSDYVSKQFKCLDKEAKLDYDYHFHL